MTSAVWQYEELEASYLQRGTAGEFTLHVYLATSDFHLRFVTMCAAAALRDCDPYQVRLGRSPGFGSYIAFLKKAFPQLRSSTQPNGAKYDQVIQLIDATLRAVQDGSGKNAQFGTLEKLRNHVYHGGPIPEGPNGESLTQRAKAAVEAVSTAIRTFLASASAVITPGEGGLDQVQLQWPDVQLQMWPFICADSSGGWCVFAHFTSRLPTYVRRDQRQVRIDGRGERLILALSESMVPKSEDRTFPDFIGELRADLAGFRDPDYEPHHHEVDGIISVMWVRATSTGTEERYDSFRLGHGERREWEAPSGTWVPYPSFLRHLANWAVVATRMRQQLQVIEDQLFRDERTTLGWTKDSAPLIEPMVRLTDLQGTLDGRLPISFDQLRQDIDARLSVRGSQTRIYFVGGEAGIGKTRTLITTALKRAYQVEAESGDEASQDRRPLFLYVRSTGQVLNSLQTVVSAAASETRNLNEEGVRALCRNGLIALFIDGFDELLGGVGYDDALGSLRTWIDAMGGRGVIVVSARSSYYLNQYRSSLQQKRENQDLAVEHRVAFIQRWTGPQVARFLEQHGLSEEGLDALTADDRDLLGLPFFARVYVESMQPNAPRGRPLPDLIVEQYLAREAAKLIMPGDQHRTLLSAAELRSVFESLADLMAAQGEREVTLEDLQFAVQVALGSSDLDSRRGLANRLSVLCGIAVSGGSAADRRFAFQHELFYDFFLADSILQNLKPEKFEPVFGALSQAQWRVATVSRIARLAPDQTKRLLELAGTRAGDLPAERRTAFRSNVGSLWEMLSRRVGKLHGSEIIDAMFETLDLTNIETGSTRFERCEFQTLLLPPTGLWSLQLINCEVGTLWVKKPGASLSGIKGFDSTTVSQLLHQDALLEKPSEIEADLRKLGVPLPPKEEAVAEGQLAEAAAYFLGKIKDRADSVFIMERGYKSADEHARWPHEYGDGVWADFIRLLKDSEAATFVSQSASGSPILRVKFLSSVDALCRRDASDAAVARFWELVAGRR